MLKNANILIFICIVISCKEKSSTNRFNFDNTYINTYFSEYSDIYILANDSIKQWLSDSLYITSSIFYSKYKLDSVLIFNNQKNCFFGCVFTNGIKKSSSYDYICDFYGRKINGEWYFFFGSTLVLPREHYQNSIYTPMSFEELSYIAYQGRFKYFVENNKPLPEDFQDNIFGAGMVNYLGIEGRENINRYLDSMALVTNAEYHSKKMSREEIAKIQKNRAESVRPPEPKKEVKAWWQFWKDEPKVPIFETEEWKDYLKQKYGEDWEKHR